jgi:hypothetical protein
MSIRQRVAIISQTLPNDVTAVMLFAPALIKRWLIPSIHPSALALSLHLRRLGSSQSRSIVPRECHPCLLHLQQRHDMTPRTFTITSDG